MQFVMDSRLLGVQKIQKKGLAAREAWEFDVFSQGYRYHMSQFICRYRDNAVG